MVILIVTLLLAVGLLVVLYPALFRHDADADSQDPSEETAQNLRRARDRVYEELRVLQQEHFLHHLSDEEYQEQLHSARVQAALLLRQQQRLREDTGELDQMLEEEVRRALDGPPPSRGQSGT